MNSHSEINIWLRWFFKKISDLGGSCIVLCAANCVLATPIVFMVKICELCKIKFPKKIWCFDKSVKFFNNCFYPIWVQNGWSCESCEKGFSYRVLRYQLVLGGQIFSHIPMGIWKGKCLPYPFNNFLITLWLPYPSC
jgi:hypothetical protein